MNTIVGFDDGGHGAAFPQWSDVPGGDDLTHEFSQASRWMATDEEQQ
jgi:hypothetical protein